MLVAVVNLLVAVVGLLVTFVSLLFAVVSLLVTVVSLLVAVVNLLVRADSLFVTVENLLVAVDRMADELISEKMHLVENGGEVGFKPANNGRWDLVSVGFFITLLPPKGGIGLTVNWK